MKRVFVYTLLLFALIGYSCSQTSGIGNPIAETNEILKNFMSFLVYRQKNVKLSEDFVGLDSASSKISKETFLRLLSSGRYLPLRLISRDSTVCYKLFNLNASTDKDIRETIKNWAAEEYEHYKMEGKEAKNNLIKAWSQVQTVHAIYLYQSS